MVGHTAIVYSVDSHASGLIVSGSEDRFAKVWKGNTFLSCELWQRSHGILSAYITSVTIIKTYEFNGPGSVLGVLSELQI